MKIQNPDVTLRDEARCGVEEQVRSGFLDWLFQFTMKGDDGEFYALGGSILSMALEKMDLVSLVCAIGTGGVQQLPNSIYKITRFPGAKFHKLLRNPQGTLKIEQSENCVVITCGENYKVECYADHRWHFILNLPEENYSADLWHKP